MPTKNPLGGKQRNTIKKRDCKTIVEEVERFKDLAPRMHELILNSPKGTRIYLSVRNQGTIH
jgi:hypothetical protein